VSFYNESPDYAVYPTPTIGMVGLIEDTSKMITSYFKNEGDIIAAIGIVNGNEFDGLGGSEYVKVIHDIVAGDAPDINLESEKNLINTVVALSRNNLINSAHDVSDGGAAVAIAESCLMNKSKQIGCTIGLNFTGRRDFTLFRESQNIILISLNKMNESAVIDICSKHSILYAPIGKVGGNSININNAVNIPYSAASEQYFSSIYKIMESQSI